MTTDVTYHLRNYRQWDNGTQVVLYLVPGSETRDGNVHVLSWAAIGGGTPGEAWNHRWLCLGTISQNAPPAAVQSKLETQEDRLLEIAALYEGSEWDRGNWVGHWDDEDGHLHHLVNQLDLEAEQYLDAVDWFADDLPDLTHRILTAAQRGDSLETVAQSLVTAWMGEAWLDLDDVRTHLEDIASAMHDEGLK